MDKLPHIPDQYDMFLYTRISGQVEDLANYKHNGFHPVLLGDVLPKPNTSVGNLDKVPRYRILEKLGHGGFATVWLARDLADKRYVSVKICVGTDAPELSNEAAILSELRNVEQGKAGLERIIQLLDLFTIKGPNGFHECLVTEVVSPLSDIYDLGKWSPEVIRQVLEGFSFLHEQGIVHGDPHLANFGVALPQLEQSSEDNIIDYFAIPEIIPVLPHDASLLMSSLPVYATPRVAMADFLNMIESFPEELPICIKILDFGRAHRTSEKLTALPGAAPIIIRPPEVVVYDDSEGRAGSAWSKSADIWAVGCTIYQIQSHSQLIFTRGSLDDAFVEAVKLGGPPPDAWLGTWKNRSEHGNDDGHFCSRDDAWRKKGAGKPPLFLDLVKRMVVTNPDKRTPVADLLGHPFFGSQTSNATLSID